MASAALKNTIFLSYHLDISLHAGGYHLGFQNLLREFCRAGEQPNVYIEHDPTGEVVPFLKNLLPQSTALNAKLTH